MKDPFALIVALIGIACTVGQYMRTIGRAQLNNWPFFQTESRAAGYAATAGYGAMSLALIGIAICG